MAVTQASLLARSSGHPARSANARLGRACATCQVRHGESVLWRTGSLSYDFHRTCRQGLQERAAVGFGHDAVVEDDNDAAIGFGSDQTAYALPQFQDRFRQ